MHSHYFAALEIPYKYFHTPTRIFPPHLRQQMVTPRACDDVGREQQRPRRRQTRSECSTNMRGNGVCDPSCLSAGCNWVCRYKKRDLQTRDVALARSFSRTTLFHTLSLARSLLFALARARARSLSRSLSLSLSTCKNTRTHARAHTHTQAHRCNHSHTYSRSPGLVQSQST
jgi:hypothetical protein